MLAWAGTPVETQPHVTKECAINTAPETNPEPDEPPIEAQSLRGTMTAVLLMAAFFVATWVGVFLLMVGRR